MVEKGVMNFNTGAVLVVLWVVFVNGQNTTVIKATINDSQARGVQRFACDSPLNLTSRDHESHMNPNTTLSERTHYLNHSQCVLKTRYDIIGSDSDQYEMIDIQDDDGVPHKEDAHEDITAEEREYMSYARGAIATICVVSVWIESLWHRVINCF